MPIDPRNIHVGRATGLGDMGDVTDVHSVCRWRIDGAVFVPVFVRAKFTDGTGSATLSIKKNTLGDTVNLYDFTLKEIATAGTSGKANVSLTYLADELYGFPLYGGEDLVLEWTNPDAGTMRWAVEVGLIDAASIR